MNLGLLRDGLQKNDFLYFQDVLFECRKIIPISSKELVSIEVFDATDLDSNKILPNAYKFLGALRDFNRKGIIQGYGNINNRTFIEELPIYDNKSNPFTYKVCNRVKTTFRFYISYSDMFSFFMYVTKNENQSYNYIFNHARSKVSKRINEISKKYEK